MAIAPVTIHNGQRWTTARGYLHRQKNLTVVTKAEVRRVIIRNGRAVGVEYRRRGRQQQAFADQEVVVSAGAFGSPQLLQLSGVGPADHLRSVGITALVDSPRVGDGLTDHPATFATWDLAPGHIGLADAANPKWLLQWLLGRRGKLTSNIMEALAHVRSTAGLPACDFQIVFAPIDVLAGTTGAALKPTASVMQSYWTPKSRGSVLLRSADPATPPAIRMNLLTERDDVDALMRAIKLSREIIATEPIASTVEREISPGRRLGPRGAHQAHRYHHRPSGQQRRDGQRTRQPSRREASRSGCGESPRRRRLRAAADSAGQYQRALDHDRRTLRGFPARGCLDGHG